MTFSLESLVLKKYFSIILLSLLLLCSCNSIFRTKSWDKKTFAFSCKESENRWKSLTLDGKQFNYCFLNKEYENTNSDGTDNFTGNVLLDVDKKTTDSITASKMCSKISKKIGLKKFTVFRTCQAYRIYISSEGPKNKNEKEYLIENYFGTYTDPKPTNQ
jgi:hypothetical protein